MGSLRSHRNNYPGIVGSCLNDGVANDVKVIQSSSCEYNECNVIHPFVDWFC